ncbi:MAG: hypothetical protein JOS17DRAFT_381041 [Linnemannia elongata]|nr:MAG: hypothetical protein JOS17DRAFT_381041 [Linnemannia elongata]
MSFLIVGKKEKKAERKKANRPQRQVGRFPRLPPPCSTSLFTLPLCPSFSFLFPIVEPSVSLNLVSLSPLLPFSHSESLLSLSHLLLFAVFFHIHFYPYLFSSRSPILFLFSLPSRFIFFYYTLSVVYGKQQR